MPINNIPGVGPTNADIATAVAAPSAATIAATVAAPSAATIAATVAAPSAATIATAVAGAVPTLGQINTSVSTNAPSSHAWTLLGTVTPNNTANSVTFSGLSGYRTYKIVCAWIVVTGQCDGAFLRINGDATSQNYTSQGVSIGNNNLWGYGSSPTDKYILASGFGSSSGQISGIAYIYNASSTGPKDFSSNFSFTSDSSSQARPMANGSWPGTAAVNSITLLHSYAGTFGGGKSIYLFGAN
jgi:hypothetical protein